MLNYEVLENGDLRVYVSSQDKFDEFIHSYEDGFGGYTENIESDDFMEHMFEWTLCNSELQWMPPRRRYNEGIMSEAPILLEYGKCSVCDSSSQDDLGCECDDDDNHDTVQAWYFEPYMLTSPVKDLMVKGECIFTLI